MVSWDPGQSQHVPVAHCGEIAAAVGASFLRITQTDLHV